MAPPTMRAWFCGLPHEGGPPSAAACSTAGQLRQAQLLIVCYSCYSLTVFTDTTSARGCVPQKSTWRIALVHAAPTGCSIWHKATAATSKSCVLPGAQTISCQMIVYSRATEHGRARALAGGWQLRRQAATGGRRCAGSPGADRAHAHEADAPGPQLPHPDQAATGHACRLLHARMLCKEADGHPVGRRAAGVPRQFNNLQSKRAHHHAHAARPSGNWQAGCNAGRHALGRRERGAGHNARGGPVEAAGSLSLVYTLCLCGCTQEKATGTARNVRSRAVHAPPLLQGAALLLTSSAQGAGPLRRARRPSCPGCRRPCRRRAAPGAGRSASG